MKEIFIFRHGETDWNREGRFQGHLDIPINALGREQARFLVAPIRDAGIEAVLSSDLCRAYETARIVANALGLPIFVDSGLREAHLGEAQGLLREEIERMLGPVSLRRWKSKLATDADISYPGGESGSQVIKRVFWAIERFLHERSYQRIAVSTHGGVIRRVMAKLLPSENESVPIPNGVLYRLSYDLNTRGWKTHR